MLMRDAYARVRARATRHFSGRYRRPPSANGGDAFRCCVALLPPLGKE